MSRKHYHQSIYVPKHPEKYVGTKSIKCRSSWERKFCVLCDTNPNVLSWNSEGVKIPYLDENNTPHNYYVDFLIKILTKDGIEKLILIEVKPLNQTLPPKKPKRISKSYVESLVLYNKNIAKWNAAKEYGRSKNMEFKIITEQELGV
jgi:hypothetical protein